MPLDSNFFKTVERLRMPGLGTEAVAPLLYSLIRATRPRRLLEIGLGYTTPFILQALADNVADFDAGVKALAIKTEHYKTERAARLNAGAPEWSQEAAAAKSAWADSEPPLADPAYYSVEYAPLLYAFDNHSEDSAAKLVHGVVQELHVSSLLHVIPEDFRGGSHKVAPQGASLDFVWLDCGGYSEYLAFFKEYWDLVCGKNGLVVMHYTLNNPFIGHIVKDLKLKQATTHFNEFELLSFLEPHKFRQNSFTILRKYGDFAEDFECMNRTLRQLDQ